MAIKAIIELQARSGKRDEMLKVLEEFHAVRKTAPGFLGYTMYEVIDEPDMLVEIADWETREARQAWLEASTETGLLNRLVKTLKHQFKAMTIQVLK